MKLANCRYRRFNPCFILAAMIVATVFAAPAQAELIDLSSGEQKIEFATMSASWARKPDMSRVHRYLRGDAFGCTFDEDRGYIEPCQADYIDVRFKLLVDEQGKVLRVDMLDSSGIARVDRIIIQELQKSRVNPFINKGKVVKGMIMLPIRIMRP